MPELPEVETICKMIRTSSIIGEKIERVRLAFPPIIKNTSKEDFLKTLQGSSINTVKRKGKYLLFFLSNTCLIAHLRMTGKFLLQTSPSAGSSYERLRIDFANEEVLIYDDVRKFGHLTLCRTPETALAHLGYDPFDAEFTDEYLKSQLTSSKKAVKPFLLDQSKVAGIGNIYADEALWYAQINPQSPANSLAESQVKKLHDSILRALKIGIEHGGTSLGPHHGNYHGLDGNLGGMQYQLKAYARAGKKCFRCDSFIKKIVFQSRGTHFCPVCQKENA